ncbi:hypothetical protein G5714_006475 [Onychostoma macrolepis]|uniref:Uncharacterized protein n=1 Tax=Onychostoma macrolepis TaxID=369639 RepID=A0A7J6D3X9_9TELE|nr:hypothetical protein G5714_006475 [Onychostoma macrolepis]
MPTEKRRIQERERRFREAAKGSTSLQGWLRKSQPADEEEQSQASSLCEENVDQEEAHRSEVISKILPEQNINTTKLVKSRLRNQCGQERLSDLLLLAIEKDIGIDKKEVLKIFVEMAPNSRLLL